MYIDEKTKISLFAVMVSFPVFFGGILWLAAIDAKASVAKEQLDEVKPMVTEILTKVIRIEEQIKRSSGR